MFPKRWQTSGFCLPILVNCSARNKQQKSRHLHTDYQDSKIPRPQSLSNLSHKLIQVFALQTQKRFASPFLSCQQKIWWSRWESNPRPLECHSSALPTELRPHSSSQDAREILKSQTTSKQLLAVASSTLEPLNVFNGLNGSSCLSPYPSAFILVPLPSPLRAAWPFP